MTARERRVYVTTLRELSRPENYEGTTLERLAAIYEGGNRILAAGEPRNWRERLLARFGR